MPTVAELGITGIKRGMIFKDPHSQSVEKYEVISDVQKSQYSSCDYFNIMMYYTDGTTGTTAWYDYELTTSGWIAKFEQIVDSDERPYWEKYQSEEKVPTTCWHNNKKKVLMITSGYWFCTDCKESIRDLSEEEFYQAVKEQFGGKEVKRAPEMDRFKRKRR